MPLIRVVKLAVSLFFPYQVENACSIALQTVDSVAETAEDGSTTKSELLQFVKEVQYC